MISWHDVVPFLWAFMGAFVAVGLEVVYRQVSIPFQWWWSFPAACWVTFCVYKTINGNPSTYLVAMATYSLATCVIRLAVSSTILHEPLSKGNLVAGVMLLTAVVVGKLWR